MSDLFTLKEYQAIAADLDLPRAAFIDGKYRRGAGAVLPTVNPATGETLAEIAACDASDVDLAVGKAREAFDQGHWSKLHPAERKDLLIRLCKLITRNRRELAVMESLDSGKPIRDCEEIDIPESIHCIKWHAELIDKVYDQVGPAGDDAVSMIVREPIGVVAAVLPWNFPLLMLAWKIGPALAAGNSVIVKPAEQTSLTALRVAELASEAGVPNGVLQVLPGDGPTVGAPLGLHMDVDMVSFTGSTETGKRFLRYSADSNMKRVVLECGGKNPAVVLADAENLDHVAEHVVNAAFWNMGENCSAASRLIVHKDVKAPLMERITARMRDWKTGDPLDPANHLGALVDAEHLAKVAGYLRDGDGPDGPYVEPRVYEVAPGDALAREEVFGPILSVIEVASTDEAIALANDTSYGLAASVFTANTRQAIRAAREIKAGTVTVNCYGEGDSATPFGGYKQSGFGGRDNGVHAHDQFTEVKTIWIDLTDPSEGDNVG
ncbi:Aldehyde dehydrogenase [Candidatus Rhodobacter oscarellae]|uniref:Aldehyde dehydrogenase n=1 Tax=Candidatus Rhodobacter oscarellae TaxID=1675527 RepID=A0A0J9EGM0_9RHOB|nr:aldehyde dehydrogenase [Candidatus Rhodobacter lobularis]KMW60814.1 Aldehyde dehydrogenase [Candidatus Rhodobacter lobularis]